jgi:hypothetical protein
MFPLVGTAKTAGLEYKFAFPLHVAMQYYLAYLITGGRHPFHFLWHALPTRTNC